MGLKHIIYKIWLYKWFRIRIPRREGRLLYREKSTVVMGRKKKKKNYPWVLKTVACML